MTLYRIDDHPALESPVLVAAFDGWVDAGGAATAAAERLADGSELVATFEAGLLFDYRARRPTLEILDGRPTQLTWAELAVRLLRPKRPDGSSRDIMVFSGAEPDFRWPELAADAVELAARLGVTQWISLGAIPAAVPHTRPVSVMGTESRAGLLRAEVTPGPAGSLRVPAAAISVLDMAVAAAGIPAVGYFAQVPHYVTGAYPPAAIELLRVLGRHLDIEPPLGPLVQAARQLRSQLDAAASADDSTRSYIERLEGMVDEARLPSGDDLISDIERYLRERGGEGRERS